MTPCYTRHELLPGVHQDIPHEHAAKEPTDGPRRQEGELVPDDEPLLRLRAVEIFAALSKAHKP